MDSWLVVCKGWYSINEPNGIICLSSFADRCNTPWNLPINFHSDLITNHFSLPIRPQELLQALRFMRGFCSARIRLGSIGWPNPAPLCIDDCLEIHNLHWEMGDLLQSNHQNFLHKVRLRHCVLCTKNRVNPCRQEHYYPRDFLWILAVVPVCRNLTGVPILNRGLHFIWFWFFGWLCQRADPFSSFNVFTWHSYWMWICPTRIHPCFSSHCCLTLLW